MIMDVRDRYQILVQLIRKSRKNIIVSTLIASVAAVFIFLLGSYFFLFHYYEKLNHKYYSTIVKDVSLYQSDLISKERYREDIRKTADSLLTHRGVINVWFTDKHGRLIYHTDESLFMEYKAKRLPHEYYDSIQRVWQFQEGSPVMRIVPLDKLTAMRISMPLYSFSREDYDFIIGMDVKRFIFIPDKMEYLIPGAAGYVVFSILLLFLPVFLWVRARFDDLVSHARMVIGQIGMEREKGPAPGPVQEPAQEPVQETAPGLAQGAAHEAVASEPEATAAAEATAEAPAATAEEAEPPLEHEVSEKEKTAASEKMASEKIIKEKEEAAVQEAVEEQKTGAVITGEGGPEEEKLPEQGESEEAVLEKKQVHFLKVKETLFKKQALELSFLQASNYVFHSKNPQGSYLFYHKNNGNHFYSCFSSPPVESPVAVELIPELRAYFKKEMASGQKVKDLYMLFNEYCIKKSISMDMSVVFIDENNKNVEYASCGSGYAVYLKSEEESVKELRLENLRLGILPKDKFGEKFTSADIKFKKDDVFVLLPGEASELMIDDESYNEMVKTNILDYRGLSAQTIGMEVIARIESIAETGGIELPETGFVILKFL